MSGGAIPIIRVRGTHREVGRQVGEATRDVVRQAVDFSGSVPSGGRTPDEQLALAAEYRDVTGRSLPWLIDELDGVAEAAGVDPLALFAASIEEIWERRPSQGANVELAVAARGTARGTAGRCSDLVATPPLTADGHTWIAHTNDLSAATERDLVAIEWSVPNEPVAFSVGVGPWISVGWNDAGLVLSGNELTPNDERVGVPRLLMVREQLRTRTLDQAIEAALRPDRASSYNTVFADRSGRVVNVEGSATAAELTEPTADGALVHTNHFACPTMLGYEGDPAYARRSAVRYRRAGELLAGERTGSVTGPRLLELLADHANAPDSICRHVPDDGTSATKTVFWAVTDATDGTVTFGRGNPCEPRPQQHRYAPGA